MKDERVEFRTSHNEKKQFEEAAFFLGMKLSSFVRFATLEKSLEVIKRNDSLILSDKDRDKFLNALENPPQPNENLKKAYKSYKKAIKK